MGRKAFFARHNKKAKERRRLLWQRNGYIPGAYKEEDAVRNKDRKLLRTKRLHQQTLNLWLEWVWQTKKNRWWQSWLFLSFTADPENGFEDYKPILGCLPLSYEMVKEFIRWHANSTSGRLCKSGKPTVRTAKAWAERFFGGFKETTGTEVTETDRKEIYNVSLYRLTFCDNTNPILFRI